MPGYKVGEFAWRYLTAQALHRTVAQNEAAGDLAAVDALEESIDMQAGKSAYDNALTLAVIPMNGCPAVNVEIYADMGISVPAVGHDRWCLWHQENGVGVPTVFTYRDVPAAVLKILVAGVTAGEALVIESHST